MLNRDEIDRLTEILGELTPEQKAMLAEALEKPINEKKLLEILDGVDERKFAEFMQAVAALREETVLGQELSPDEIEATSGGIRADSDGYNCAYTQAMNCVFSDRRYIYQGGFPNCAATVEDGSHCGRNDACYDASVAYLDLNDCAKAWR